MVKTPAFVLGSLIGALGIVQSLGSRGVPCWVCAPKKQIAARSRFARFWHLPEPHENDAEILSRLRALARKTGGRPVVFAADDSFALVLARLAPEMEAEFSLCSAPLKVVEVVNDKDKASMWARAQGLPCLDTIKASELRKPKRYPVVIKPVNKFSLKYNARNLPAGTHSMDFVFTLVENEASWSRFRDRLQDDLDQFVVQDYMPGTSADMLSVGIYANRDSRILAIFPFKKIRGYPAQYGETKIGQNCEFPLWLLDELRVAVRDIGLQGIAEFEFRRDRLTGDLKLLDINPRAWTWIGITMASPADIAWIAYQDLCGIAQEPVSETRATGSLKLVFLFSDFLSVVYRYRTDYPQWVMTPRTWWRSLRAEKLVIAELNKRDWQAGFFFGYFLARSMAHRVLTRLSPKRSYGRLIDTGGAE